MVGVISNRSLEVTRGLRWRRIGSATALVTMAMASAYAADPAGNVIMKGETGFVVTHIAYALSKDASETGACPDGMTTGYRKAGDVYVTRADSPPIPGATEEATLERTLRAVRITNNQNYCQNPELGKPDPNWRTVKGASTPAEGIDLDGQDSRANGRPAANTCAHDDFRGVNGERGVDNQFFRVVGCSQSFQSTGQSNGFETEMYTGAWGILVTLKGVSDLRNAKDVEVGIYASADPLQLSATREALPNATYAIDQDRRFRATTHGRIVNGVLTTDPVDVRFHWTLNGMYLERTLQDARLRTTVTADGGLDGYLGGYTSVEELYDFQFAFRNGKDAGGHPSPTTLKSISSIGYAITSGRTCEGVYFALKQNADGHRDPKTGQCNSISTQYKIKAIPAFVVDVPTGSVNAASESRP
jgi:hypothetical protein